MTFQRKERGDTRQEGAELSPGVFEKFVHPTGWIRDRIVIRTQDGPGGNHPVYVQVNGYTIGIPRETPQDVPRPFVEALRNAVVTVIERDPDTGVETYRNVPRYNMEVKAEGVNLEILSATRSKEG